MKNHADMLWQFLQMTDSELLEELGVSIRNWENFTYLGDLRVAYDHLNSGRASYARSVVLGVIEDIRKEGAAKGSHTVAYSFAKLFSGEDPRCG